MSTSAVEEILGQLPIDQLAARLGVDPETVAQAATAAIPSLIGGLQHNADQGDEQAVAAALAQHGASPLLEADTVDLNGVDTADGVKIVQHIFGDQSTQLSHAIGQKTGASGSLVNQLLPILAPIVLAYLAKKLSGSPQSGGGTGGILAGILGGVLGEQPATGAHSSGSSSVLGNILGGILSGGGLHSILGGVQAQDTAATTPEPTTYETQPDQTSYDPQQGSGEISSTIPAADPGLVAVDETPAAPAEEQAPEQAPQSSSSIVDEILGDLFGKR